MKARDAEVPLRQVIGARFIEHSRAIEVSFLVRKKKKDPLVLQKVEGRVKDVDDGAVNKWVDGLLNAAYNGTFFQFLARSLM